jgi:hypothetical protein
MDLVGQNVQETHHTHLSHKSACKDKDHLALDRREIEEPGAPLNGQEDQHVDKGEDTDYTGRKKIDEHSEKECIDTSPRPSGIDQQISDHHGHNIYVDKMSSHAGDQGSPEQDLQGSQKPGQNDNGYSCPLVLSNSGSSFIMTRTSSSFAKSTMGFTLISLKKSHGVSSTSTT